MYIKSRNIRGRQMCQLGRSVFAALLAAPLITVFPSFAQDDEAIGFEKIPPRLSMVDGDASFLRPGGEEWTQAQVNTPLAAGDELYTAAAANLEIQIGRRAYVRAGEQTQLGLYSLEPDYLQLRVTAGNVSLDLRSLEVGRSIEVSTPNAAFVVERAGYYRLTVDGQTSTLISRRGGHAVVTPAVGVSAAIGASEQVIVTGIDTPTVARYGASEIDRWDRWNYARTEQLLATVSAQYVSPDVYGLADLDQYGDWRQEPTYGAVWVPRRVAVDWAPYSDGRWIYDPFYGWSWVDYSPWGWAPFHHGRWIHTAGYWGWCPGPVVVRPYYAPALVAFYGGGVSVGVSVGAPFGWVSLSWGEPLVPWWGPAHFRHRPYWAGWGGPLVVNNVVVNNTTVIHVDKIRRHRNRDVRHGLVVVDRDAFGRRRIDAGGRRRGDFGKLRPVRGDLPFRPSRESLRPDDRPGRRPPRELRDRRVVSTREPRIARVPIEPDRRNAEGGERPGRRVADDLAPRNEPPPRVVQPTRENRRRPESNQAGVEARREEARRAAPPPPDGGGSRRSDSSRTDRSNDAARQPAAPPSRAGSSAGDVQVRERRRGAPSSVDSAGAVREGDNRRAQPRRQADLGNGGNSSESGAPRASGDSPEVRSAPRLDATRQRDFERTQQRSAPAVPQREQRSGSLGRQDAERVQQRAVPAVPQREQRSGSLGRQETERVQERAVPAVPQREQRSGSQGRQETERVQERAVPAVPQREQRSGSLGSQEPERVQQRAVPAAPQREQRSGSMGRQDFQRSRPSYGNSAPQREQRSGSLASQDSARNVQNYGGAAQQGAVRGEQRR